MSTMLLNKLRGKIVTVFTKPINRDFKAEDDAVKAKGAAGKYPEQLYHYFVGVLEEVDDWGFILRQATTGLESFFFKDQVVAVCQEAILDPDDPIDRKTIEKMNAAASQPAKPKGEPSKTTVNATAIQDMLKNLNNQFGTKR